MKTQTLALEDLIRLIDDLRSAGYDIGTQQYINAQRLLLSLATHGRHPARLSDLRPLIAPVLCSSPWEQEHFYEYFPRWLAHQPHLASSDDVTNSKAEDEGGGRMKSMSGSTRPWLRRHAPLVAAAVLLAVLLYLLLIPQAGTLDGVVVNGDEGNAPVAAVRLILWSAERRTFITKEDGKFTFVTSGLDTPACLTVNHSEF